MIVNSLAQAPVGSMIGSTEWRNDTGCCGADRTAMGTRRGAPEPLTLWMVLPRHSLTRPWRLSSLTELVPALSYKCCHCYTSSPSAPSTCLYTLRLQPNWNASGPQSTSARRHMGCPFLRRARSLLRRSGAPPVLRAFCPKNLAATVESVLYSILHGFKTWSTVTCGGSGGMAT